LNIENGIERINEKKKEDEERRIELGIKSM